MEAITVAAKKLGNVAAACAAVNIPRATYYRWMRPSPPKRSGERARPARALTDAERQTVLNILHEDRFVDQAPSAVHTALLDEGIYHCSKRTMYRILKDCDEVRERRNIAQHPNYKKPELIATAPNQVWSWDITYLKGPEKWTNYYLYVIMDIFSRHVVGWVVAGRETAELATELINATCQRQGIDKDKLIIHSDRGSPMTSKSVALLLSELGVTKSLSRPQVSNDNPYSESHFKTLKTRPQFPDRFGCIEDARAFSKHFFKWYNNGHFHSGIALMTPTMVHYGSAKEVNRLHQKVLDMVYAKHPERFVKGRPLVPDLPIEVWINKPKKEELIL